MSSFQDVRYNKSFSQLAKESSFTFNLYRGRVDWKKLEELDVDRVVRDQDVELLYFHLSSVTNCNLESEYDVKILDPNFTKLFRLAQLLIDFLLHCKTYLEHCIKVAYENLQTTNKEVEILRKQLQARKTEVKQLKKKFKEVKQQFLLSPGLAGPSYECSLCGKVFVSETFLHGHHSRRHQQLPHSLVLRPFSAAPSSPHVKIADKESEENHKKCEEITSIKKKYQEEIEDLKKLFFAEIEKLKQSEGKKIKVDIQTQYSKEEKNCQSEVKERQEILDKSTVNQRIDGQIDNHNPQREDKEQPDEKTVLKEEYENDKQVGGKDEEWVARLEQREAVWRARLAALDQQHRKQVQQLQDKLNTAQQQGQEMKRDLELRLEEALAKFEQGQKLLEIQLQKSVQEDNSKQKSEDKRDKAEKPFQPNIPSEEIPHRESPKRPPPFQKRRAFVSQKTKTIQDSFEIPESKDPPENLVQVLNPDDDSDLENVSTLTQNSSREKIGKTDLLDKKTPIIKVNNETNEILSRSKNKENIIARPLEEERLRRSAADKTKECEDEEMEDEDSSLSGSVTESESESGGEGGGRGGEGRESDSEDQLLREEADLAQQSLQSMEALLAANPGILQQLRADLEGLAGRRLLSLGVDPGWRGLPAGPARDKMAALAHQRNITAKVEILQQLRADLEGLAGRRLLSLGVDPGWRGLPAGPARDKMAALAHQRNITAKVEILQQLRADLVGRRLLSLGVDPGWRGLPAGPARDKMAALAHQCNFTAKVGILQQLRADLAGQRLLSLGVDPGWRGLPAGPARDKMDALAHQCNFTAKVGILQQLRADLAGQRLLSLGVDPGWRGLPAGPARDKMDALAHQRNIMAKNHPVYFTLRDKLRAEADAAVAARSKAAPRRSASESLLSRLRSKAAQVISAARFTRRLGSQKMQGSLSKQPSSRLSSAKPLSASSPQLTSDPEDKFTSIRERNTSVITKVQSTTGESFSLSSSTEQDEEGTGDEISAGRTSKPPMQALSLNTLSSNAQSTNTLSSQAQSSTTPSSRTQALYKRDGNSAGPVSATMPRSQRDEDIATPASVATPQTQALYKSALRHTVSTSNLAKKKVLFVDEAFADTKRSQSENTIVDKQNASFASRASGSESVASLVQEIQQQLKTRSEKPSFGFDLMKHPEPATSVKASELPLSEILPLSKSGRDLLESKLKDFPSIHSVTESSKSVELKSPRSLEPLSQILQKVPTTKSGSSSALGKKPDILEWSTRSQLQVPKLSPDLSLSSVGSSLLDLPASPRAARRPAQGTLEWDLQDLEDNMRD